MRLPANAFMDMMIIASGLKSLCYLQCRSRRVSYSAECTDHVTSRKIGLRMVICLILTMARLAFHERQASELSLTKTKTTHEHADLHDP